MRRAMVYAHIDAERARQDAEFGAQTENSNLLWLAIAAEEFGEVAKAALESDRPAYLITELVQLAAVIVHWLELDGGTPGEWP